MSNPARSQRQEPNSQEGSEPPPALAGAVVVVCLMGERKRSAQADSGAELWPD